MDQDQDQEKHQIKNFKGSHKDYYRWMMNEIDDFFPEIVTEDPLKRFYHLLNNNYSTSISHYKRKKLVIAKHPKTLKPVKHAPNFEIGSYWKQFTSQTSEHLIRFLDLKDIIMLMYTSRYFKEELNKELIWKTLKVRDFNALRLQKIKEDTKDRVSEKLYYKYLYLSTISGIPYHSGFFKTYGSPDVVELSESIVDFLCPKTEMIRKYGGEILMRNQCKTFDFKLSWLKEKKEICLWNGNPSLEFKKNGKNEEVETVNEFYPCFIKRYSMVDKDEEIVEVFFLEDKYLVVKLFKKLGEGERMITIFRILNLEEELYSIAKGLEPMMPFDYSFVTEKRENGDDLVDIKTKEYGVDFVINQENEDAPFKVKLLLDSKVVFYTENSAKPTMIFWDLKEKKRIDSASVTLQKPLHAIMISKKPALEETEKIKLFILDENMNIYCGLLSQTEGFLQTQTLFLSTSAEEDEKMKKQEEENMQKLKELEEKRNLNFGKKTRSVYKTSDRYIDLMSSDVDSPFDCRKQPHQISRFQEKIRRCHHTVYNKKEWLIVHKRNKFHFINLDEEKIHEFSSAKDIELAEHGNWHIYEDNLIITDPERITYYMISFEDYSLSYRFFRRINNLSVQDVGSQWIFFDPCFTVMIFTHISHLGFTTKLTIVITSTQEFLYNNDIFFNVITYKVQAEQFFRATYKLERGDRDLNTKFENSKIFIGNDRSSFYFDLNMSTQPYNKVYLNGWMSKNPIHTITSAKSATATAKAANAIEAKEETEQRPKQKMVNYMKLAENPNVLNAKEKSNGWKKSGKGQAKKDEDKEYRVMKGKGDKYQKNVRQGQRSEKVN